MENDVKGSSLKAGPVIPHWSRRIRKSMKNYSQNSQYLDRV
jgi:hypothetical protein